MKIKKIAFFTCLLIVVLSYAQNYTPLQADSIFKSNNWKETIKAYTWLVENGKAPRPGIAWYRIAIANYSLMISQMQYRHLKDLLAFPITRQPCTTLPVPLTGPA